MESPDVNILVQAFRRDTEAHDICFRWLEDRLNGPSALALSPLVLSAFLRIVTHHKIFAHPSSWEEAMEFCEVLRSSQNVVLLEAGTRHWVIFKEICAATNVTGNLVPDAWLAAMAIEHGATWITLDRDFKRFGGLRVAAPAF